MNHDDLQRWVKTELGQFAVRKGHAVYSGSNTWIPGRYYIMGYNPAMDDTNELLDSLTEKPLDWSLYLDKCWHVGCGRFRNVDHIHPFKPHQKRVQTICKHLGLDPRSVFATNAIFVESQDAASLDNKQQLWERCWRVHLHFLGVVQPDWIICLGNAEQDSSFALLKKKIAPRASATGTYRDGKQFVAEMEFHGCLKLVQVLGLPHPSRFPISAAIERLLAAARR